MLECEKVDKKRTRRLQASATASRHLRTTTIKPVRKGEVGVAELLEESAGGKADAGGSLQAAHEAWGWRAGEEEGTTHHDAQEAATRTALDD